MVSGADVSYEYELDDTAAPDGEQFRAAIAFRSTIAGFNWELNASYFSTSFDPGSITWDLGGTFWAGPGTGSASTSTNTITTLSTERRRSDGTSAPPSSQGWLVSERSGRGRETIWARAFGVRSEPRDLRVR
jgi:hypothetical protein